MYNLRPTVYSLKVRYGQKITLVHTEVSEFDADTGEQEITVTEKVIYRAVLGDQEILRIFGPSLGANYGGAVDHNKRYILIDRSDLPDSHVFTRDDQVTVGDEQWRIIKFHPIQKVAYFIEAELAHE
jgi:hypothetical protein